MDLSTLEAAVQHLLPRPAHRIPIMTYDDPVDLGGQPAPVIDAQRATRAANSASTPRAQPHQ